MSWIWNFLATLGRMGRNVWNEAAEQARNAELRRMREQGRKGISPDGTTGDWGHGDSYSGDKHSQEQDTGWGVGSGDFWGQNNNDQGSVFGSTDTDYGGNGGGDFGGSIGGGFDGGGDGGGGGD